MKQVVRGLIIMKLGSAPALIRSHRSESGTWWCFIKSGSKFRGSCDSPRKDLPSDGALEEEEKHAPELKEALKEVAEVAEEKQSMEEIKP
ncbi:unnamed protein product [Victoria cruziana]